MHSFEYRGLTISFRIHEEPHGVFWPNADIEDKKTGEIQPVSLPQHAYSEREAVVMVTKEAVRRILNEMWRR